MYIKRNIENFANFQNHIHIYV